MLFKSQKKVDLKMHLLTSSILFLKDSWCKCQFCTKVRTPPVLVFQVLTWEKYEDEVADVTDYNRNIETLRSTKLT